MAGTHLPHVCNMLWARGFVVAIILAAALSLTILSMGLPIITKDITTDAANVQRHRDFGLWRDCRSTRNRPDGIPDTNYHICERYEYAETGNCGSFDRLHKLARGAYIMALVFCVIGLCFAMLNALGATSSKLTLIPIILYIIAGVIGWVSVFVLFSRGFCDAESLDFRGARLGASAPCLLTAWMLNIVAVMPNCALRSGPHDRQIVRK